MRNRDEEQKGKRNEKKFGLENNRCAISFSLYVSLSPSPFPSLTPSPLPTSLSLSARAIVPTEHCKDTRKNMNKGVRSGRRCGIWQTSYG